MQVINYVLCQVVLFAVSQKVVKEDIQPVIWALKVLSMDVHLLLAQTYVSAYVLWAEELTCLKKLKTDKVVAVLLLAVVVEVIGDLVTAYAEMVIQCVLKAVEVAELTRDMRVRVDIANVLFLISYQDAH